MNFVLTAQFSGGLFTNGLQQNIVFLATLLKDLGHEAFIAINHPTDEGIDMPAHIPIIQKAEILSLERIDYLLQTGWAFSTEFVSGIRKIHPGVKNVHIHYGNRLLADIEQSLRDTSPLPNEDVDEVWVSPHYEFAFQYLKVYYNTPRVFTLPYIWSPTYIEAHSKIWEKMGKSCHYNPAAPKLPVVVEPNLNMTKNCIPSIMICEEALRRDSSLFTSLTVNCSSVIASKRYFKILMWNLDIQKEGKLRFDSRKAICKTFAEGKNVMVSHQLLNGLNYTYLEALYFNIPLVHNSEYIRDAGYYYPNYDVCDGATQLIRATREHDNNLEEYKAQAQKIMWRYSPENPDVKSAYKRLLG